MKADSFPNFELLIEVSCLDESLLEYDPSQSIVVNYPCNSMSSFLLDKAFAAELEMPSLCAITKS